MNDSRRAPLIDVARGGAVVAMISYHFTWDLWAFGLTDADLLNDPFWLAARTVIVSSFLFIAGVCAALPAVDRPAALRRRFVRLAAAAALVSAATWLVFPQSWVFFGILHHMAVAGSAAAGLRRLRLSPAALAVLAVAVLYLGNTQTFDALNAPWLRWLGMGSIEPDSNDYVPLFPWFGVVLAGMAAAAPLRPLATGSDAPAGAFGRGLARLGRYSLMIYLLHQPILYGGVWAYAELRDGAGGENTRVERDFTASCVQACLAVGSREDVCIRNCVCSRDGLQAAGLWLPLLQNTLTPIQAGQAERTIRACAAAD